MLESSLYSLSYVISSYLNGGYDYTRMGNSHQLISPYSVYKTSDNKWIVIGVATNTQFDTFCNAIDLQNPNGIFSTNALRLENRKLLDNSINETLKKQQFTLAKLTSTLSQHGIPYSEINSIKGLFENPTIKKMEDTLVGKVQS